MRKNLSLYFLLFAFVLTPQLFATQLVHFEDFGTNELHEQAFKLSSDQMLTFSAVGPRTSFKESSSYIWILDLKTREPVWVLDDAESERGVNRRIREFSDEISLKAGTYKIFYSTIGGYSGTYSFSFSDFFNSGDFGRNYKRSDLRKFELILEGKGNKVNKTEDHLKNLGKHRIVDFSMALKNVSERVGLKVKRDTEIDIYAVGEITRDGIYDGAWIKNMDTGRKVWEMDRYETEYAGGGEKNRSFRGKLALKKGTYLLNFATDDSHHFDSWNVIPPYDPEAWGISVYTDDKSAVEIFDAEEEELKNVFVDLTALGDNEYVYQGFTLEDDTKIRVRAIGEGYRGDDLVDYGWIVNTSNRRKVWEMEEFNTDHAGGDSKNRIVDEIITLPKGSYKVYYVSDDSHSYGDGFNASKPHDPKRWGIMLSGFGDDFDKDDIKPYKDEEEKNVLVQMTRMRDHDYETKRLVLKRDTRVRIYCIGEGSGDMHDYGWIKNMESGRRVWRMAYHDTEHAGGAQKNRVIDEEITLRAGEYKVYYKTDDSHSFRDWNATPPNDQEHWGITIYKLDD